MTRDNFLSRRTFLLGSAAVAGLLLVSSAIAEQIAPFSPEAGSIPADHWALLHRLTEGQFVRPADRGHANSVLPDGQRSPGTGLMGIAYCSNLQMVADVIAWCRDHEMPFVIRGGSLPSANYSTKHGLVIDISQVRWENAELDTKIPRRLTLRDLNSDLKLEA